MTQRITVDGMSCDHCEQSVEEALEAVSGVATASADRDANTVTVEGSAEVQRLVEAIEEAGYEATP